MSYEKIIINGREFEYSRNMGYYITEIKTLQDLKFDCERYKNELFKQIHIDNVFSMLGENVKLFMTLNEKELIDYLKILE